MSAFAQLVRSALNPVNPGPKPWRKPRNPGLNPTCILQTLAKPGEFDVRQPMTFGARVPSGYFRKQVDTMRLIAIKGSHYVERARWALDIAGESCHQAYAPPRSPLDCVAPLLDN